MIKSASLVATALMLVVSCSSHETKPTSPTSKASAPSSAATATPAEGSPQDPAEYRKLLEYLGSKERSKKLHTIIQTDGRVLIKSLQNGVFAGSPNAYDPTGKALKADYSGRGVLSSNKIWEMKTGGQKLVVEVYWDRGEILRSLGIQGLMITQDGTTVRLHEPYGDDDHLILVTTRNNAAGQDTSVDTSGYYQRDGATVKFVRTAEEVKKLDDFAVSFIGDIMKKLYKA